MKFLDDFKNFNRVKKVNIFSQCLLIILLLIGVYVMLPYSHFRFDFSSNGANSLHATTQAFLKTLRQPLKMIVLLNERSMDKELLKKIRRFSCLLDNALKGNRQKFEYKEVDDLHNPKLYTSIKNRYQLTQDTGVLLLLGDKSTLIPFDDLEREKYFLCESVVLNALSNLGRENKKIYWVTGHGELDGRSTHPEKGGSVVYQILQQMHCDVHFLDVCSTIPEDADDVVIFGPQIPFLPQECKALRDYLLNRHGHILLCLHPVYAHGLEELLKNMGIFCESDLVLDSGPDLLSGAGNLLIRRFNKDVITQPLIDKNVGLVFGLTTRLIPLAENTNLVACALSSETSWVKTKQQLNDIRFNENTDVRGPHVLCFRGKEFDNEQYGLNLHPNKWVVVGCADWLDNAHINMLGNRLFLQAIYHSFENGDWFPQLNFVDTHISEKLILNSSQFLILILNFLLLPFIFVVIGIIAVILRKE